MLPLPVPSTPKSDDEDDQFDEDLDEQCKYIHVVYSAISRSWPLSSIIKLLHFKVLSSFWPELKPPMASSVTASPTFQTVDVCYSLIFNFTRPMSSFDRHIIY